MKYLVPIVLFYFFCCSYSFAQKEIRYVGVVDGHILDTIEMGTYPRWKVIDDRGNILADSLGRFDRYKRPHIAEGMFECVNSEGKKGFKDYHNRLVIPCIYDEVRDFNNGYAAVAVRNKWGLVNKHGRLLIDTFYKYVSDIDEYGISVLVKFNQDLGCINTKGELIVPFSYKAASLDLIRDPSFSEGLLAVLSKNSYSLEDGYVGFIDRKGTLLIDTIYELRTAVGHWQDRANTRGMCGTGLAGMKEYYPYHLKGSFYKFISGKALVARNGNVIVINTAGDSLFTIPAYFGEINNSNGYFIIKQPVDVTSNNPQLPNMGVIDPLGKEIIPLRYKEIGELSGGFFVVQTKHSQSSHTETQLAETEYMLFDTKGKPAFNNLKLLYVRDNKFFDGLAVVCTKEKDSEGYYKNAILTNKGELRYLADIDFARPGNKGTIIASTKIIGGERFMGYVDKDGRWLIPPSYHEVSIFENKVAAVRKFNNWGYIDIKGNYIIEPQYPVITPLYSVKIP